MGNSSAITLSSKCLFLEVLLNSINSTSPAPQSSSVTEPESAFLAHLVTAGSVIYGHGIRPRCRAQETRAAVTSQRRHRLKDRIQEGVAILQTGLQLLPSNSMFNPFYSQQEEKWYVYMICLCFSESRASLPIISKENLGLKRVKCLACDTRKSQILFMRSLKVYNKETICDSNSLNHYLFYESHLCNRVLHLYLFM